LIFKAYKADLNVNNKPIPLLIQRFSIETSRL
jgi:hypothetical protein